MAETQRVRIVANKGRRTRRNMSAKQIRFFGTKAQRAALTTKRSRHRKRSTAKRTAAKRTRRAVSRRRPAVKHNAGEIVGYTLQKPNRGTKRSSRKPAKKGTHKMATTKKARRRSAGSGPKKHRRRLPATRHNRGHRRSNPGLGSIGPLLTTSAFALAGAAASKIIPQMVLGANNTSWVGYAANALTGFLLYLAAEKVLKNHVAATGVAIGTAVMIMDRMINDMTPFGSYLSGAGFGDYQAQAFVTPQSLVDPYNSARIAIPGPWQPAAPAPMTPTKAAAAVGVGGYGGTQLYGGGSPLY